MTQIYRTFGFPTPTCGCETWNWNAKQNLMSKLEGIQYRFLHTVQKDNVSCVDLLKLTTADETNDNSDWATHQIIAVDTFCRLARLRYAGHVACMAKI